MIMPITERFFVPGDYIDNDSNTFVIPPGKLMRQMVSVLRMKVGDRVVLCPNDGSEISGIVSTIGREEITGDIAGSVIKSPALPHLTLAVAITKKDSFEMMLQKVTELGVDRIIPLHTDRTIKRTETIPERWRDIVKEASEQSGRVYLPIIDEPMSIGEVLGKLSGARMIVLHESGEIGSWPENKNNDPMIIFVGPEGGLSMPEVALIKDAGATAITLAGGVLRAETAAMLAAIKVRY